MNNSSKCSRDEIDASLVKDATKEIKLNKKELDNQAKVFSLLGNEVRLKIIYLIMKYEKLCVCDLSDILGMNQSPISQHLRKLKDAGILENRREGLTVFYSIPNLMKDKLQLLLQV